jgi:hypothetical protein
MVYIYIVPGSLIYDSETATIGVYRGILDIGYVAFIEYDHFGRKYENRQAINSLVTEKAPRRACHKNNYKTRNGNKLPDDQCLL